MHSPERWDCSTDWRLAAENRCTPAAAAAAAERIINKQNEGMKRGPACGSSEFGAASTPGVDVPGESAAPAGDIAPMMPNRQEAVIILDTAHRESS